VARRTGLLPKYAMSFMVLVGGAVMVAGLIDLGVGYRSTYEAQAAVQRAEVRAAAVRIASFLDGIRLHVQDSSSLPWASGLIGLQDRREEYQRLMKLVPAIAQLRAVDARGVERLRASRLELDEIEPRRDAGASELLTLARERGTHYSATYFRGLEPYVTLAVRDRDPDALVTLAELNLRFVGEVVGQIHVADTGRVYVVDSADNLVAHPDANLVLRGTALRDYAPLQQLRSESRGGRESVVGMIEAQGLQGEAVMVSAAHLVAPGWLVVLEQSRGEVMRPVYATLLATALWMAGGVLAALGVGYFLARRLAQPIVELRRGASRLAGGDLSTRIAVETGDEVEALGHEFNRMADQLQEYTAGLERKVAEKTAQLELANRHKTEFLANMSHELRTPLNAIIGFSEVLKERMFGSLNPKQLEYVSDIYGSGQHLLSLINDILDLSKVEAGRMELEPREIDVAAILDNCVTLIRERAQRQMLKLTWDAGLAPARWRADERKFKQVVLNLLSNAVKFTPHGGAVGLQAREVDDWLEVSVSDTGVGIAPGDLEEIFREFRQVPQGPARHEGTGLGLALSRRLVELHGGTLTVRSEPRHGSTFTARFPREPGIVHG
jgi:signal transduction histidine kinase